MLETVIGAFIGGFLTLAATWLGFRNQRKIIETDQRERQKGASRALIAEMAENLARLNILAMLARESAPAGNMYVNLKVNRHVFDEQLPLLALRLSLGDLQGVSAAYAGVSILFATLEGKWRLAGPLAGSEIDAKALDFAKKDFEQRMRAVAKVLLTKEELQAAGLEDQRT